MIKKPCCSRFSLHKFVHLNFFWTQFKNVHLRGPCSLRPCISRPYCNIKSCYCVVFTQKIVIFHRNRDFNLCDSRTLLKWFCSDLFHIRYQIIKIPSLLSICFSAKLVVLVDKSSLDPKLKKNEEFVEFVVVFGFPTRLYRGSDRN